MTNLRGYSILAVPLLAVASLSAHAEPPAMGPSTVTVDCDHRYISQTDAARVMHTDNFWQTYAKRQSLYANVARLCQTGISQVVLMAHEPQSSQRPAERAVASR